MCFKILPTGRYHAMERAMRSVEQINLKIQSAKPYGGQQLF